MNEVANPEDPQIRVQLLLFLLGLVVFVLASPPKNDAQRLRYKPSSGNNWKNW